MKQRKLLGKEGFGSRNRNGKVKKIGTLKRRRVPYTSALLARKKTDAVSG